MEEKMMERYSHAFAHLYDQPEYKLSRQNCTFLEIGFVATREKNNGNDENGCPSIKAVIQPEEKTKLIVLYLERKGTVLS